MITFKQFLDESVNDAGLFKAIFVVGLPGAGKTYTVKALNGAVSPRVVNTDVASEFLARKFKTEVSSKTWGTMFKDSSQRITMTRLQNYLNGMLPLFIDGTSNDPSNVLHRMGILKSLGYDVGLVHVQTDLKIAIERANARTKQIQRETDEQFIRDVAEVIQKNVAYLKGEVSFFQEVQNDGSLDNEAMNRIFRKVQWFFSQELKNPIGAAHLKAIQNSKAKYLTPSVIPSDVLGKKIQGWYKS